MDLQLSQVLTQIVAFLIMLAVLRKFAWGPVLRLLEERKEKIQNEFDDLAKKKQEAEAYEVLLQGKIKQVENESRVKIQDAVNEGQLVAKEIEDEAHEKAKSILVKAQEDAEREYLVSIKELRAQIVRMAISASEKILEKELNPETQEKLVESFVKDTDWK